MSDLSIGLFITWTVYGTFLSGDERGWRHRRDGPKLSQPRLNSWQRDQLNHDLILLDIPMRSVVESAIEEICEHRSWILHAVSARSNHVHAVLSAAGYKPSLVREQLKAKATRELRSKFDVWQGRPVWTAKGDIEYLDSEDDIEQCVVYTMEAQDRKGREQG